MNAFIAHTTSNGVIFNIDPERITVIVITETQVQIHSSPMMWCFGPEGSIYGTKFDGLEIRQKILTWRDTQFDRAEKLKNMLAEDPELEPGEPA